MPASSITRSLRERTNLLKAPRALGKSNHDRRAACLCNFCAPLRELRRRLVADRRALGNEQALLFELIVANPPVGGMAAYLAAMDGPSQPDRAHPQGHVAPQPTRSHRAVSNAVRPATAPPVVAGNFLQPRSK